MSVTSSSTKASLLLILGLVAGVWLTLDPNFTISQCKLVFESMMFLTLVWMLIDTIRKRQDLKDRLRGEYAEDEGS